jgi:hypothetical protein
MDKRKDYFLLLINAGVRNCKRAQKIRPHYVDVDTHIWRFEALMFTSASSKKYHI